MNSDTVTLLEEDNLVSRRTAFVNDDGDTVGFQLMPSFTEQASGRLHADWSSEFAWLYRHMRSPAEEKELVEGSQCMAQGMKPMEFNGQPTFKLLWSESGNSVAICVNGEPWAFIDGEACRGYSKGILVLPNREPVGNPWDEARFKKLFKI